MLIGSDTKLLWFPSRAFTTSPPACDELPKKLKSILDWLDAPLAAVGLVSILTVCLSIYGTAGLGPNVQPADATIDNPPADLFTKAGWAEFASGFWLGGCGGAAFAWFLAGTTIVAPLVKIAGGVWSVG